MGVTSRNRGACPRVRAMTVLTGLAAVLLVAGCSRSGDPAAKPAGTPAAGTGQASDAAAASAHPTGGSATGGSRPAKDVAELVARMTAAARAHHTARVSASTGADPGKTQMDTVGEVRFRASGMDESLRMEQSSGAFRLILVDGVMYLGGGPKIHGKDWIKIAPGPDAARLGIFGGMLSGLSRLVDPAIQLTGATRIVSVSSSGGGDTGVTTYVLSDAPPASAHGPGSAAATSGAHREIVVSVDPADLPLRIENKGSGASPSSELTQTVTYSHWGEPVSIAAPPPADVADVAEALAAG